MSPELTNLRDIVGWIIGRSVVDVTCGDPPDIPDSDDADAHDVVVHFDNGGTLTFCAACGFRFCDPDRPDDDDAG